MDPARPRHTLISDVAALLPEIPADSIVSRTVYSDADVKVILFGFAQGQELSEHTAGYPAILYFLHGAADVTLGDDAVDARPGTWVHMPAHLRHSIVAKTPVRMLLLLLKTPKT